MSIVVGGNLRLLHIQVPITSGLKLPRFMPRPESHCDMLEAMNTGHEGSMTTIHANSAREALVRIETMISLSGFTIQELAMRQMVSSSIDAIIQLSRGSDGTRRMMSLSEVSGMESGVISLQDIFVFDRRGVDAEGGIIGEFRATGVRPKFADRCQLFGAPIPVEIFNPPAGARVH